MCRIATIWVRLGALAGVAGALWAQSPVWRRIGNASVEAALPALATGPVERVWYSADGSTLHARLANGKFWETNDFENWKPSAGIAAPTRLAAPAGTKPPESDARIEAASAGRAYAFGRFVYRSEDSGLNWTNVTAYRNQSILGDGLADMAVSPRDPEEISVASAFGLWRSLDGGTTWSGVNDGLPNLPASRILTLPNGYRAARVLSPIGFELEWLPGQKTGWRPAEGSTLAPELYLRAQIGARWATPISSAINRNEWIYAGSDDGRLFASGDRGLNWQSAALDGGAVKAIFLNPRDNRNAIAVQAKRVYRTTNGGQNWDDISGALTGLELNGLAVDAPSGTVYVASAEGVRFASFDIQNLTGVPQWQPLTGAPAEVPALDVRLDDAGHQLFILLEGFGLYATMSPHRMRELAIVNAADFSDRPAAPGSLLSILGGRFDSVRDAVSNFPVLGRTATETQIQVPFEVQGDSLSLTMEAPGMIRRGDYRLAPVSPSIFIDRDGAPLLLDADSGTALDAQFPARSGARIQILAAGLGAVSPRWPTGSPAPLENAPRVVAPVQVFLDRQPVEVVRATLAPGYIGFYLIEIQLPRLVNAGPAELYVAAGERSSNRVTMYLAP